MNQQEQFDFPLRLVCNEKVYFKADTRDVAQLCLSHFSNISLPVDMINLQFRYIISYYILQLCCQLPNKNSFETEALLARQGNDDF